MKTCSNCQMTDIPDEYKFCPKCGTALAEEQHQNKYRDLSTVRDEIVQGKALYDKFEKDRKQMLAILDNDNLFQIEKEEYFKAIRKYREKRFFYFFMNVVLNIIFVIFIALAVNNYLITIEWVIFAFLCILFSVKLGMDGDDNKNYKSKVLPSLKPKVLREFISKNLMIYQKVENNISEDKILKMELKAPKKVEKDIREYIKKLELSISEINTCLQSIEQQ